MAGQTKTNSIIDVTDGDFQEKVIEQHLAGKKA